MRRLIGWDRYDTEKATDAINDLYGKQWRLMMNLFQPSVKLLRKVRVGSRLIRKYDKPQTPLDRLLASAGGNLEKLQGLLALRQRLDPFQLADAIERKLEGITRLANGRRFPKPDGEKRPAEKENAPVGLLANQAKKASRQDDPHILPTFRKAV